jgi:hypothetical protein
MKRSLQNAKGPEVMEAGWKHGLIESCEVTEAGPSAKNAGAPMLKIAAKATEGDDAGRFVTVNYMLDETINGSNKTKQTLEQLNQLDESGEFDDDAVAEALTGLECYFKVTKRRRPTEEDREQWGEFQNGIVQWSLVEPTATETHEETHEEATPPKRPVAPAKNGVKRPAPKAAHARAGR